MRVIDKLNELHLSGDLKFLIWSKSLKDGVARKMEVYLFFNKELLINKDRAVAVTYTSETLKRSERYVYKAIEEMERDIFLEKKKRKKKSGRRIEQKRAKG